MTPNFPADAELANFRQEEHFVECRDCRAGTCEYAEGRCSDDAETHWRGLRRVTDRDFYRWIGDAVLPGQVKDFLRTVVRFWSWKGEIFAGIGDPRQKTGGALSRALGRPPRTTRRWLRWTEELGLIATGFRRGTSSYLRIAAFRLHELARRASVDRGEEKAELLARVPPESLPKNHDDPLRWVKEPPAGWTKQQVHDLVRDVLEVWWGRDALEAEIARDHGPVLSVWRKAGCPSTDAFLDQVRQVLNAMRECRERTFRYELRGRDEEDRPTGEDRTRGDTAGRPNAVFVFSVRKWEHRVEVAAEHAAGRCGCHPTPMRPAPAVDDALSVLALHERARRVLRDVGVALDVDEHANLLADVEAWRELAGDDFDLAVLDRAEQLVALRASRGRGPPGAGA